MSCPRAWVFTSDSYRPLSKHWLLVTPSQIISTGPISFVADPSPHSLLRVDTAALGVAEVGLGLFPGVPDCPTGGASSLPVWWLSVVPRAAAPCSSCPLLDFLWGRPQGSESLPPAEPPSPPEKDAARHLLPSYFDPEGSPCQAVPTLGVEVRLEILDV